MVIKSAREIGPMKAQPPALGTMLPEGTMQVHDMTNKPERPALEAWLAEADRVLSETRDASLSPSGVYGPWDPHRTEATTTLASLEPEVEDLLARLAFGPGRWALIIEDQRGRYVQAMAYEDGSLYTEAESNNYLGKDQQWQESDEAKLASIGWSAPRGERRNWSATFPTIWPDIGEVAALLMTTLRTVFDLRRRGRLEAGHFQPPYQRGHAGQPRPPERLHRGA
jgi:hypothetical protein